eukprot:jgi/Mesen1/7210/ME000371S06294
MHACCLQPGAKGYCPVWTVVAYVLYLKAWAAGDGSLEATLRERKFAIHPDKRHYFLFARVVNEELNPLLSEERRGLAGQEELLRIQPGSPTSMPMEKVGGEGTAATAAAASGGVPRVDEAGSIEGKQETGRDVWADAIKKEIRVVKWFARQRLLQADLLGLDTGGVGQNLLERFDYRKLAGAGFAAAGLEERPSRPEPTCLADLVGREVLPVKVAEGEGSDELQKGGTLFDELGEALNLGMNESDAVLWWGGGPDQPGHGNGDDDEDHNQEDDGDVVDMVEEGLEDLGDLEKMSVKELMSELLLSHGDVKQEPQ